MAQSEACTRKTTRRQNFRVLRRFLAYWNLGAVGGRVFYRTEDGLFAITKPLNGEPASGGNGSTIGFSAASPEQCDAWHEAGLASGGTAIEDPPGIRESSGMKMYLAYLRDPGGNKVCVLHRM